MNRLKPYQVMAEKESYTPMQVMANLLNSKRRFCLNQFRFDPQ